METKKMIVTPCNRCGFTIIELMSCMVVFGVAFFILTSVSNRAVEIARAIGGKQYGVIVPVVTFIATILICVGITKMIQWLRIRYGTLFIFPLLVGLPLGFAAVPFRTLPLHFYFPLLVVSLLALPAGLFLLQSAVILSGTTKRRDNRTPIPEKLPAFSEGYTPQREKPIVSLDDFPQPRHPNVTQQWLDYRNTVKIHHSYAVEAYVYDNNIEEFRKQYSLYCQKDLLHYKQPSGYVRFWDDTFLGHTDEIVQPCAALDFQGAQDWANFVRKTLPENIYRLSQRDEQIIRGVCAAISRDEKELFNSVQELQKPFGYLDKMITVEPEYWPILIEGLFKRNIERCYEAIRIQSEIWYLPFLSDHCRLNITGVAMSNLCRWYGVNVPALEPVVPEELLLHENSDSAILLPLQKNE